MTQSQVIDRAVIDSLLAETGGDPAFLAELLDVFFTDTPELLTTIDQALATGNALEVRRAAHALKSNSASFGANTLAGLCRELEKRGEYGALDGADGLLRQIEVEYAMTKQALQTIIDTQYPS